jgi:hypothetical protein
MHFQQSAQYNLRTKERMNIVDKAIMHCTKDALSSTGSKAKTYLQGRQQIAK